jgi:hypothetical protein
LLTIISTRSCVSAHARQEQEHTRRTHAEALSRSDTEKTDISVSSPVAKQEFGWVNAPRDGAGLAQVQSGANQHHNGVVDSPKHREVASDAQRDIIQQLQVAKKLAEERADALAAQFEEMRTSSEAREQQLQRELRSAQAKLSVLKEQLMTGQADAEESGRQMLEDATQELAAKHANELQHLHAKVRVERKSCCSSGHSRPLSWSPAIQTQELCCV